ncbi:MAG: hypothetical protein HZC06_01290 [Methylocystis sp.]|nr:hypothetical protein [Methylocystis sp.]
MDLKPYANYLRAASAMIAGVGIGLFATVLSLNAGYGFNSLRAGAWTAWPHIGGADIDPYARAVISRSGEAPLGGAKDFVVMLRLYDTPLDIESAPDPNSFPKIVKLGCA